jgi:hypothetical protein
MAILGDADLATIGLRASIRSLSSGWYGSILVGHLARYSAAPFEINGL